MNELTFIPLKTSDGQVAGHARVQSGLVALNPRAAAGTQALILTETGYVTGEAGAPIRAGGRVLCVALHEHGKLRCCGFARDCPYTLDDVRARLCTLFPGGDAADAQKTKGVEKRDGSAQGPCPCNPAKGNLPLESRVGAVAADVQEAGGAEKHDRDAQELRPCNPAKGNLPLESRMGAVATDVQKAEGAEKRNGDAQEPRPCDLAKEEPAHANPLQQASEPEPPAFIQLARARAAAHPGKPCACSSQQQPCACETCADSHTPDDSPAREANVRNVLDCLSDASAAAFFAVPDAAPESAEDTAGRAESFAALLERCEAVFQKISAPETLPDVARAPSEPRRTPTAAPTNAPTAAPVDPDASPHAPGAQTLEPDCAGDAEPPQTRGSARELGGEEHPSGDQKRSSVVSWHASVDALLAARPPARGASDASPAMREPVTNPFPHLFPNARFYRECDSNGTHLLIGTWRRGCEQFTITAVRGEYSPRPPEHLPGFTRYIRTRQGGFWVRVDE